MRSLIKDTKKADIWALGISVVFLFLLFALRAPSVGRDIMGYKEMYENLAANRKYGVDTYWTEKGYDMLELFFGRTLKADWQVFMAFCSGVSILAYFFFIKRYSKDPALSLLIYVLMGHMVFDLSAVRNMLSVAICLAVMPLFEKKGFWPAAVVTLAVIAIATQIHSSAYIFFLLFILYKIPINSITVFFFISLPLFFFGLRGPIMSWAIATFKKSAEDTGASLGGNSFFYAFILFFTVLVFLLYIRQGNGTAKEEATLKRQNSAAARTVNMFGELDTSILMPFRMVYIGTLFTIFIGSNTLVRMAQYGLIFTVLLLPNVISKLEIRSRVIVRAAVLCFLILYFYFFKVRTNDLDFLPYVFYWNG